ncbi:E3 ubiquitin-protein ligase UHRF1-like [Leptopilina heterotoma]|uniref:E3 ubiquitin-protein ligase UHRF1-like n=1 Tax=Leptopilina heterotoma TaxID=63436 RepID=UPI001CA8B983|nr:E3 ubiquitin-protein ligase UHRF1-like [Leptopilina heterotoma]XP_043481566.1 E3 ubiquitin-protein ligase UHRF1-like [Leptopilina heterotoma]
MYIRIRTVDGKKEQILTVSKLTFIEDLKNEIKKVLDIEPDLQRLFHRGKQLENGYKLFDYNVNLNDVILLNVKINIDDVTAKKTALSEADEKNDSVVIPEETIVDAESLYYRVGDAIDCVDQACGAWYEATIQRIINLSGKIQYQVKWQFGDREEPFVVEENFIRPRAYKLVNFDDLRRGLKVMINYNIEEPNETGLWYDLTVQKVLRSVKSITGTLHIGQDYETVKNCKVRPQLDEIFAIEKPKLLKDRDKNSTVELKSTRRRLPIQCKNCMDDLKINCTECACKICGERRNPENILLCDECNGEYHLQCLNPPLSKVPDEDYWYCPSCKNDENEIVMVGNKLRDSKKRKNRLATKEDRKNKDREKRDWGKGMACAGRTKHCTIVAENHRGAIPNVEVGMCWRYRIQASEAGVHRPPVSGIHGRENDCAYSIVLSGGYEDDVDNGEEFYYTGSGGRDLTGNKRTAVQSCDQVLTLSNKALALNCYAEFDSSRGATSDDWMNGIPVRVLRSCKLAKHSKFAPKEGIRYDGLYKVVKYYPELGKSGFKVWRYVLRRDDPTPAPWTEEGKKRIKNLGIEIIYPDGYFEFQETKKKSNQKKRKAITSNEEQCKRTKLENYQLDDDICKIIRKDKLNDKFWQEFSSRSFKGKVQFLKDVTDTFTCVCCQELVLKPITTPCTHNTCLMCLKQSFEAEIYSCPHCRFALSGNYKMEVNKNLSIILETLFPGYEKCR